MGLSLLSHRSLQEEWDTVDLKNADLGLLLYRSLVLPPVFATTVFWFILLMALSGLFNGGIMVPSNSLIALSVSQTEQGWPMVCSKALIHLVAASAIIGGVLASTLGLKSVFPVSAALFIIAGV